MSKFIEYIKETKAEMKNVTWPTRRQAVYFTLAVIIISVVVAYYLGLFDFIFAQGLQKLLLK